MVFTNFTCLFVKEIENEGVRKEAYKNFIIIFFLTRQDKNLNTICACTESTDLTV
jgi:hypothetical protein